MTTSAPLPLTVLPQPVAPAPEVRSAPRPIALLHGQLGYGGSERQLWLLLQQCDRTRWAPHVYAASHLGPVADGLAAAGIPVTLLDGSPAGKLRSFRRLVREQQAQALLSWSSWTNVFAWSVVGLGLPVTGSFRNAGYADLPAQGRVLWSWASRSHLGTLVCNSQETADELSRHARRGQRVVYLPNAVEPPGDVAGHRRRWRRELGIGDDEVLVMGIGRLTPQKAFGRFVEAVALAHARTPVKAVVLGPDYEGAGTDLVAQIAATGLPEGALRYLGPTGVAREMVCAADVFLLSSLHEGMPNVVLEAMSAGVPCVVTPVSGIASVLTSGVDGIIAEHSASSLADAVVQLAEDPALRRVLGGRARRRLLEAHAPARVYGPMWDRLAQDVDRAAERSMSRLQRRTRVADVVLCLAALPVVLPLVSAAAVALRLDSEGPVLHRSVRVGRGGEPFVLHKLRTMRVGSNGPVITPADDPRVTRVGRWLRRSKLDELPQLFDVLAGRMSLVGPRPEDPRYVDLEVPAQRTALRVRPGLTSPASIAFCDEASLLTDPDWERTYREVVLPRKLALDNDFVARASLTAYARVLVSTGLALLPRRGKAAAAPCETPRTPWP